MLPAGLAHAIGAEFSGPNFVLAVRNTFLTVEEPPKLVRRHSWPADLDTAETWDASGFEGDLEGDDSDWEEEEEEAEEMSQVEVISQEAADSAWKMSWIAANRPNSKPDHMAALSEHMAALTDDERMEDADEASSAYDREANNLEMKYRASRLAVKADLNAGFTTDDQKDSIEDLADMSTAASTPPAPVVPGPPSGIAFQEEVRRVAEEVAQALCQLEYAPQTEAIMTNKSTDEGICTITATLAKEHQDSMKHLLTNAKDEIFQRTNRSRGVCLLGYKKTPFTSTPDGFTAMLGTVSPKRQACRQFYAEGRCKYMDDCYWQHPQSMASMTFIVVIKTE